MIYLKDETELNSLTINELIILYFGTISEANHPHIKVEGGSPYESYKMKERYIKQHKNQAMKIIKLLNSNKVKTNYFYLKYKYIQLKYLKYKNDT